MPLQSPATRAVSADGACGECGTAWGNAAVTEKPSARRVRCWTRALLVRLEGEGCLQPFRPVGICHVQCRYYSSSQEAQIPGAQSRTLCCRCSAEPYVPIEMFVSTLTLLLWLHCIQMLKERAPGALYCELEEAKCQLCSCCLQTAEGQHQSTACTWSWIWNQAKLCLHCATTSCSCATLLCCCCCRTGFCRVWDAAGILKQ